MTTASEWQGRVGETWAAEWRRTDRAFAAIGTALVDRAIGAIADVLPRDASTGNAVQILDVGCGAGSTSLGIAEARDDVRVLGIDLSPDLIDIARERASDQSRCRFAVSDAASWSDPAWTPDLIVSRHGVMFFDRPVEAFAHLHAQVHPGTPLVFSCFRSRAENSWASAFVDLLPDASVPIDCAPGPFGFANLNRTTDVLKAAGWRDVVADALTLPFVTGGGSDPENEAMAFHRRIGSTASALAAIENESERDAFLDRMRAVIADHRVDGEVRFTAGVWIVRAVAG